VAKSADSDKSEEKWKAFFSEDYKKYYFNRGDETGWVKPESFTLSEEGVDIDARLKVGADAVVKGKDMKITVMKGKDVIDVGGDPEKMKRHVVCWSSGEDNGWVSTLDILKVGKTAKMVRINRREGHMVAFTFADAALAGEWKEMITILWEIEGKEGSS
jgi:hypothetical protein